MSIDTVRTFCLSLPAATEDIKWGSDLAFSVGGKMFAVVNTERPHTLSFKCTPENFVELCERQGIIPAPYMARAQWVALETLSAVTESELRDLLAQSYQLVWERLPKKRREALASGATKGANKTKKPAKKGKKRGRGRGNS